MFMKAIRKNDGTTLMAIAANVPAVAVVHAMGPGTPDQAGDGGGDG
jgi:hypothetical protein